MICPKCGAEIPEGRLYCQVCGNAIQIVPDFEPDIEEKLASTRQNIAGAVKKIDNTGSLGGDTVEIPVQVNGKVRGTINVQRDSEANIIIGLAKEEENVKNFIAGKDIIKEIYVPGKILNIVVIYLIYLMKVEGVYGEDNGREDFSRLL